MSLNLFERSSRSKLRFSTNNGFLTTEDLWDLDLPYLDRLAKAANRAVKSEEEESFLEAKTPKSSENELRLEILKHVITSKLSYKKAAETRAEKQAMAQTIKDALATKQNESILSKSPEELEKMLEELQGV